MNESQIMQLKQYIEEAHITTFYGGAGVSTESGIPDYRSREGTYTKMEAANQDPKKIMNRRYIKNNPIEFFNRPEPERGKVEPNSAHKMLAALEKSGHDIRVITQNVDGLHQKAGHRWVLELHGSGRTWYCMDCERVYLPHELQRDKDNVPRCYVDNGIVRPGVVFFGENVQPENLTKTKETIQKSDLLIIAGTSLTVFPANQLIYEFKGRRVVMINKEKLPIQQLNVDLYIEAPVGETFAALNAHYNFNL
ncbi:NAD-dependent protein deacylase [Fundicoccus culcitae]|uniref:protein acetyllysine N-acetyltransferase n=1 Tax=Fundicoccus culcitae TaxID=2969821 RepID=A0ABY5P7C3_9LACT|nr:NAD-dependent protein deacylase [Fundicoccus culcitae]UUX34642.1 NAD-dependent protein deacylase [Fundicoccus culcitae]